MGEKETAETDRRQAEMLANRVSKRYRHLCKRFARQNIEIFRLYDWDIPEIRAVVDWYGGHLVVAEYARRQSRPEWLPMMGAAVAQKLGLPRERLHLKQRRLGSPGAKRYERLDHSDEKIVLSERDLKFLINPRDFIDTGLFADHRETRQMIRREASNKDFLNLFCYTGSFTCYAAKGGARRTVSVDRSETVIAWAHENFRLNGLEMRTNKLVHAPVFEFLKKAREKEQRFDLAVVDPPSYSTTRAIQDRFDILMDHPRLLLSVKALMRPGGVIYFSTNHQGFVPEIDDLGFQGVVEITDETIPEDFVSKRKTIHRCWKIQV